MSLKGSFFRRIRAANFDENSSREELKALQLEGFLLFTLYSFMPTPPTRTYSSSTIFQLKLNQRLWARIFVQTRKLLGTIDSEFYGDASSYEQAYHLIAPLEDHRDPLHLKSLPSRPILNEFAMEAAYRLSQSVHTTPMQDASPFQFPSDDTVEAEHLLSRLLNARSHLFSGAKNPPHALPVEMFSESFWDSQFSAFEEKAWIEFLLYMARTCFSRDESATLVIRSIAHLALGEAGNLANVYESLPSAKDIEATQRAWNLEVVDKIGNWTQFREIAQACLQRMGVDSKQAAGLIRNFSAHVLGHSMNALMVENVDVEVRSSANHEELVENFFRDSMHLAECEQQLGEALVADQATWAVVLVLESTLKVPFDCAPLPCKILGSNPAGNSFSNATESYRYAHFEGIKAHDPRNAIASARKQLDAFFGGLSYALGKSPDSRISTIAYCQINAGGVWQWIGSGEMRSHPSRLIDESTLKEWSETTAKLLGLAESNKLAARVVEALRIYRNAKEARDRQQQFTELWLLADMFLQHTNNPEDDLPLYQLVYSPAASPKPGSAGYVDYQKNRWIQYREDARIFWQIRNHGAIHHGQVPRWEERSLRLWTMKLEDASTLVLRYNLNACFLAVPPKSPKEILKNLKARFKHEGIF